MYHPLVANACLLVCIMFAAATGQEKERGSELPSDKPAANTIEISSVLLTIIESVDVPAEQAGVLTAVEVKEGQVVTSGELVAKIRDQQIRLQLERAQLETDIAKLVGENDIDKRFFAKSLQVDQAEVDRALLANKRVANSVSAAEIESLELLRDKTELEVEQAERDYQVAKMKVKVHENEIALNKELLSRFEIRSPMDGMVVGIEKRKGEWVEPSNSILRVVRLDRLRVEGFVSAFDASRIRGDEPIQLTFSQPWLEKKTFSGKVVFVNPEANPVNNNVQIWAEIENPEFILRPGLRANMAISVKSTVSGDGAQIETTTTDHQPVD